MRIIAVDDEKLALDGCISAVKKAKPGIEVNGFQNGNAYFRVEAPRESYADGVFDESTNLVKFRNCCWFTNIDHGRRHEPLKLMTMAENLKHSKHKEIRRCKD